MEERGPVVSVRGEATLELSPEVAFLYVTITGRDADRAKAMHMLNERAGAVDEVMARFEGAVERVETSSISVSPLLKSAGKSGQRVVGYNASVRRTVTVTAFDRLGELTAGLADWDLSQLSGPVWALRPDSPAYRRVRLDAVADAVRRARDYAAAIGSDLRDLLELADTSLLSRGQPPAVMAMAARGGGASGAPEEFTFEINPVMQVVHASVEARFLIGPPELAPVDPADQEG